MIGDVGIDILTGGAGADSFVFRSESSNLAINEFSADQITDFSAANGDTILCDGISKTQIQLDNMTNIGGNAAVNDTIIRVQGGILGVVLDTAAVDVYKSFYNIGANSTLITTIG